MPGWVPRWVGNAAGALPWPWGRLPLASACPGRGHVARRRRLESAAPQPRRFLCSDTGSQSSRGCEAVNKREILVKEEQESQCLFLHRAVGYYYFRFFPSHIQSTRFLLPSGALNSSCECKAGLVRGRELRFAPADACKVTRSLAINYCVSHRKQQQERGSAAASGAGGRRGRYITS